MPAILDLPDSIIPDYCRSYIQTYVERDVRIVEDIRELASFSRFLALCAALTGQEIQRLPSGPGGTGVGNLCRKGVFPS